MKKISILFVVGLLCSAVSAKGGITLQKVNLIAKYDTAATVWESEALPIGNGYMGAMIFGGVLVDKIQVNEHTIWSGGPGDNPDFNGGHRFTPAENRKNYLELQNALQQKMIDFTNTKAAHYDAAGKLITANYPSKNNTRIDTLLTAIKGTKENFGSYQTLGNIEISYNEAAIPEISHIVSNCDNPDRTTEQVAKLFDGDLNSKWFADKGFKKSFPCFIAWEYAFKYSIKSYRLTSGNDMPARDPKSWKLYGSNDGISYRLIDTQTKVVFEKRKQTKEFSFSAAQTYKYYKLEIKSVSAGDKTTPPQLSEIQLIPAAGTLDAPTNYVRKLDIDNALHTVSYTLGKVDYTRDYFMSYPDNVMVIKLSANKGGHISRTFSVSSLHSNKIISAEGNTITLTGQPSNHKAYGLKFAQQVKILNTGGTLSVVGNKIVVQNADEVILLMSAATNYIQSMDKKFNYFSAIDPLTTVKQTLENATKKSYAQLLETHQQDYKSLYDRAAINLGNISAVPGKTTNKLLAGFFKTNTTEENLYAEMLYYQFGRYLLISSSRPNTLPANLQGVWAESLNNPWNADYHTNINVQMNYWLAEQTNLRECHDPMIKYINSLVPRGEITANYYHCKADGSDVRGWVTYHENSIWGNTGPATSGAFYFPAANAWLCQDIWDYYLFNSDTTFLAKNFNTIFEAALFWVDNLWKDKRDGSLVANPSYSPEHGEFSLGCSCDQGLITELFDMTLKAAKVLKLNIPEIEEIRIAKSKLSGPKIGLGGQFMEWKDEVTSDITGDYGHRHANHLIWLHPGSQIVPGRSKEEDKYVEGMKKALDTRGDEGTGWSRAWKLNFWARLQDGNRAHKLLKEAMTLTYKGNPANIGGVYQNLFDTHPPFQIDGNFGVTSGMTEMLIQSQGGYIDLLPALPADWKNGQFRGLKARGNFEIDAEWVNGIASQLDITSNSGNICKIKYPNISTYKIFLKKDKTPVNFTVIDKNMISFETEAGNSYEVEQ